MELSCALKEALCVVGDAQEVRHRVYALFDRALGIGKKEILLEPERELSEEEVFRLRKVLSAYAAGVPIDYIFQSAYFYGREFYVDENVLIPRFDTERSVEVILEVAKDKDAILEIGTGSGCVAVTLAKLFPGSEITATDISHEALRVAKINREKHDATNLRFLQSDLFDRIEGRYALIYSNPPYISAEDMKALDAGVYDYEPHGALYGGVDGLDFHQKIAMEAPAYLYAGGYLVFEIGYDQYDAVSGLMSAAGFEDIYGKKDYGGHDRVIVGRKKDV